MAAPRARLTGRCGPSVARALGVSRATFYRRHKATPGHQQPRPTPARALCESEREHVLNVLRLPSLRRPRRPPRSSPRCSMKANTCARSARCIGSWPANQPVRERRNQLEHPPYTKPELVATGANETWSWDITRLLGPTRWSYFYLYVLLDIFSRYVVGWMVAERENAAPRRNADRARPASSKASSPRSSPCTPDRGAPMTSKCTAQLLADLGVTRSLSRPRVSDDNPFSEAQFKTLKYHPGFPGRFDDIHAAIAFCRSFFPWYNTGAPPWRKSPCSPPMTCTTAAPTPCCNNVNRPCAPPGVIHPDRFVRGIPKPLPLPEAVWINPPAKSTTGETAQ